MSSTDNVAGVDNGLRDECPHQWLTKGIAGRYDFNWLVMPHFTNPITATRWRYRD